MAPNEEKEPPPSAPAAWKIPGFEPDDEYLQDMSHEDLQSLALKLKGYGEAADPLGRKT
jgi:hypothetical protein